MILTDHMLCTEMTKQANIAWLPTGNWNTSKAWFGCFHLAVKDKTVMSYGLPGPYIPGCQLTAHVEHMWRLGLGGCVQEKDLLQFDLAGDKLLVLLSQR